MSIGAVLDLLRPDFPDVTISKIRFLEAEGLVTPQRSGSGYRRFTAYDCARLRFILTAQRDQYLPLKVIKAQLDAQPDGELPSAGSPYSVPRLVPSAGESDTGTGVAAAVVRLSREDLLDRSGVGEDLLSALCKAGVITTGPGGLFDEHSVVIAQCARALGEYGVEPRHLRADRRARRQGRQGRRPRPRRRPGARGRGPGDHPAHLADQVRCARRSRSLRTRLQGTALFSAVTRSELGRGGTSCAEVRVRWVRFE
jgi:DNA-binding transcriptional MerR regulator